MSTTPIHLPAYIIHASYYTSFLLCYTCIPYTGTIYRKLVHLSPTHTVAVNYISQFEQFLLVTSEQSPSSLPATDDIDDVCILSFNYGVNQLDYGDVTLAEGFLSKALGLVKYASESVRLWEDRMQVYTVCDMIPI